MTEPMSTDALELYCRNRAGSTGELTEYDRLLLMDVSDRLCALQAENAEKDKEIGRLRKELTQAHTMDTLANYNQDFLRSEIKRVEAERDAAVKDIKRCCDTCMWYQVDSGGAIRRCRRGYEPSVCMECVYWEWRGVQGEA